MMADCLPMLNSKKMSALKVRYNQIVWERVFLLAFMHIAGMYGFIFIRHGSDRAREAVYLGKAMIFLGAVGITAGAHRLWTHRAYKATRTWEIFIMILASLTYQNSVFTWSRDHRLHHKYSETDADPHNAKRGFFFSHVGWLMVKKHPDVLEKGREIDMSDLRANPIVMFQHKYYLLIMLVMNMLLPIWIPWYYFNTTLHDAFYINAYRYMMNVNLTWCVNSVAHLYGNKPYDKTIGPVQITSSRTAILLGEGYHNYHHTYPYDYRASEYEMDFSNSTTIIIDCGAKLGLLSDCKTVPRRIVEKRRVRTGDGTSDDLPRFWSPGLNMLFYLYVL